MCETFDFSCILSICILQGDVTFKVVVNIVRDGPCPATLEDKEAFTYEVKEKVCTL